MSEGYFFVRATPISRGGGRSATAAAAYRAAEKITDNRQGLVHDYRRKAGVVFTATLAPAHAPEWASDRARLWNEVEANETRANARVAREIVIGLPHELTDAERQSIAVDFAQRVFVDGQGMVADVAIHRPHGHGDHRNHHAHIMLTDREFTQAGDWARTKNREWNKEEFLEYVKLEYANEANKVLALAGSERRLDSRSYDVRDEDLMPQIHLGPAAAEMERRGVMTEKGNHNRAAVAHNLSIAELKNEAVNLEAELIADSTELLKIEVGGITEALRDVREQLGPRAVSNITPAARIDPVVIEKAMTDRRAALDVAEAEVKKLWAKGEPLVFGRGEWRDQIRAAEAERDDALVAMVGEDVAQKITDLETTTPENYRAAMVKREQIAELKTFGAAAVAEQMTGEQIAEPRAAAKQPEAVREAGSLLRWIRAAGEYLGKLTDRLLAAKDQAVEREDEVVKEAAVAAADRRDQAAAKVAAEADRQDDAEADRQTEQLAEREDISALAAEHAAELQSRSDRFKAAGKAAQALRSKERGRGR